MRTLDSVSAKTQPTFIEKPIVDIRMCYASGKKPYDPADVILCDWNGIIEMTAEWAFGDFVPEAVFSLHHFFVMREDQINYTTHMTFVSRNVFKRTEADYIHRQPISGYPVLRDDGMVVAVGIAGREGEGGCYLSLVDVAGERLSRAVPDGYSADELESASVIPLAWAGREIHAVMILKDGLGVYFMADGAGKVKGSIELTDTQFDADAPPRGYLDPLGAERRIVVALRGGYFVIDPDTFEADYFKLGSGGRVLGVANDGQHVVWTELDGALRKAVVRKRDIASGKDAAPVPYGLGLQAVSTSRVFYSLYLDCIYFELGGDIWRMDVHSGVQGPFTDSPGVTEKILWVM